MSTPQIARITGIGVQGHGGFANCVTPGVYDIRTWSPDKKSTARSADACSPDVRSPTLLARRIGRFGYVSKLRFTFHVSNRSVSGGNGV